MALKNQFFWATLGLQPQLHHMKSGQTLIATANLNLRTEQLSVIDRKIAMHVFRRQTTAHWYESPRHQRACNLLLAVRVEIEIEDRNPLECRLYGLYALINLIYPLQ